MLIEQLSAIFAGYCSGLPGIQQLKKKSPKNHKLKYTLQVN